MESGHHKGHSKASSEEIDSSLEQVDDDDTGTGRPYECMFCRRGFSTAQALGGHMNIHRRDRARIRQPPKPDEETNFEGCDNLLAHQGYRPVHHPASESLRSYNMYFPAGSSSSAMATARESRPSAEDGGAAEWQRRRELRMFGGDLHLGLGAHVDGRREEDRRRQNEEDRGLDLELRLGHEP